MNAAQQYLLDSYRAAQRGEAAPPAPGVHTVRTAREITQWRRFLAVVAGRQPAAALLRGALGPVRPRRSAAPRGGGRLTP
ncbi:hypothetical protein ACWDBF_34130 [Streptomyces angustmyceticus]|uniref:hypothetical protein n=1 Tax=Streptomyces angustmyceticus TaxID=285578 RepID=UPI0021B0845D|nr:hypothetical protein [Streptomyces angustmyceticus]